jgi:membrane protease YdiL (CAAX protease family)
MAAWLWAYWTFIRGDWGSPDTAASRRSCLRANRLSADVWIASLSAGMLGFVALFAFVAVIARLVTLPTSAPVTTPEGMPAVTAFLLVTMSSIVAGVTEEAAFRGYMQTRIERRYGLALAILVSGTAFGLLHFPNHPADVLTMLPYYIAVSAVYGGLTWAANSILPALVLHSGGDVWSLGRLWLTGRAEYELSSTPPALVRNVGVDGGFVMSVGVFVALTAVTIWAYASLHRFRRTSNPEPGTEHSEG